MTLRPLIPQFNLTVLALTACSSEARNAQHDLEPQPSPETGGRTEADAAPPSDGLDLPVPDEGFQVRSVGADILPGEDVEYCEVAELPGDPSETYHVTSIELANAAFSHHLVLAPAIPGTEADAALRALNVGDRVECNGANFEWPEPGLGLLASAQTPHFSLDFPQDVGTLLSGGQRIVFDYHYLNTSEETVRAKSALNVHASESAAIEHIAIPFSFFNFTVDVPPRSTGSFTAECHFKNDLMVGSLVRHTHDHGRDFSVWFSGGPRDSEHVWTSRDWKHETQYDFEEPILVKAGEGFRFQCDFENPYDERLRYGIKGTDEMCILAGWIWPTGDEKVLQPQDCNVTWVDGEGTGHPASEAGGFPAASILDAGICLAGLGLTGFSDLGTDGCAECVCGSCGSVLLKCAADPDCAELIGCFTQGCGSEGQCVQACEAALHAHSSAIGLLQQVQGCLTSRCGECNPLGD